MKIKDLPEYERPREKALRFGIDSLSDEELLAIILGSGTKDLNVLQIANNLLNNYGGLNLLSTITFADIISQKGLKENKALILASCFEIANRISLNKTLKKNDIINEQYLVNRYWSLVNENVESLYLVVLSRSKQIKFEKRISIGDEYSTSTSSKNIIKEVIAHNGFYFYLVHNHPSGNSLPSQEDINFTLETYSQAKKLGLHLLDHVIVSKDSYHCVFKK